MYSARVQALHIYYRNVVNEVASLYIACFAKE